MLALAESGVERFRVGDPESADGEAHRRPQLAARRSGHPRPVHEPLGRPGPRGTSAPADQARVRGRACRSGLPTRSGSAFSPTCGPRHRSSRSSRPGRFPLGGGRPAKLASLAGEIAAAAWSPGGRLALLGIDEPGPVGSASLGLWVKEGRGQRRLGEELDRTFFYVVVERPRRLLGARFPPRCIWLDEENLVALVTTDGACVPYRFGLDGSVERLVERDDAACTLARVGRRPHRHRRQRRGRRKRGLRRRGRRPAAALAERKLRGSRPTAATRSRHGSGIATATTSTRGSSGRADGAAGASSCRSTAGRTCAHGPTPWLEMTALADAGFTVLYGNPRGSVGYGQAYAGRSTATGATRTSPT